MSFSVLGDLNWLAVIVATLVYFAVGALWFSEVAFAKPWRRSLGIQAPPGQRPSMGILVAPLVQAFVSVIAVAMLAKATGTDTIGEALVLWIVSGVAIAGALIAVTAVFETTKPDRTAWALIAGGYHLVGLLIATVIVSVWD
ncbi:MAG TPA: DUF1761 domain-containing protein [Actinomycetota bacterium]